MAEAPYPGYHQAGELPAKYDDGSSPEEHGIQNPALVEEPYHPQTEPYYPQSEPYNPDVVGDRYSVEPSRKNILRHGSHNNRGERQSEFMAPARINSQRVSFMGPRPTQFPTTDGDQNIDPAYKPQRERKRVKTPRQYIKKRTVSTLGWWCFGFTILTFLVTLTIFIAPGWGRTLEIKGFEVAGFYEGIMYGDYGLWYACWYLDEDYDSGKDHDCELILDMRWVPSWYKACQAMAVLALFFGVLSISSTSVYVCSMNFNKNPRMIFASVLTSIAAGIFTMILFIVYCVKFLHAAYWCCFSGAMQVLEYELHYAFIMGCIATGFWYMAAILCIVEYMSLKQKDKKDKYMMRVASTRRGGPPPHMAYPPQPMYGHQPKYY